MIPIRFARFIYVRNEQYFTVNLYNGITYSLFYVIFNQWLTPKGTEGSISNSKFKIGEFPYLSSKGGRKLECTSMGEDHS